MGCPVNRSLIFLTLGLSVGSPVHGDLRPAAWHSAALPGTGGNNRTFIVPDAAGAPRIFVKSNPGTGNATTKYLSGGPPLWTAGTQGSLAVRGNGAFVANPGGGGVLVAAHGTSLKAVIINANGSGTEEVVDNVSGTYTAISVALDPTGVPHVGYARGTNLCYARRSGSGSTPWRKADQMAPLNLTIGDTAVLPASGTDVALYYTLNVSTGRYDLYRAKPVQIQNFLFVVHNTSPQVPMETFVQIPLKGTRVGGFDRVYFIGTDGGTTWNLRRLLAGTGSTLQTLTNTVTPRGIHVAKAPDGRERIAWYDATARRLHYLRPSGATDGPPYTAAQPVVGTGNQANAELRGFHFDAGGTPYLLHRNGAGSDFIAFPNDAFDLNGNGRPELLDSAFASTTAGLEVLPVAPAVAGLPFSANRFKVRFPTIGNAFYNGASGVQTSSENLRYAVEYSTDGSVWQSTHGIISYNVTADAGGVKTYTAVSEQTAPGAFPRRFARLVVTRPSYPY